MVKIMTDNKKEKLDPLKIEKIELKTVFNQKFLEEMGKEFNEFMPMGVFFNIGENLNPSNTMVLFSSIGDENEGIFIDTKTSEENMLKMKKIIEKFYE
jgi:hypothetical protein